MTSTNEHVLRALLIEDNPGDSDLICKALLGAEKSFRVSVVDTLADALVAISRDHWDVLLADLSLPDSHGLDTVCALRRASRVIPIVVLTSFDSDETALRSLEEGAQDYLAKDDVTTGVLERAIHYAIQRQKGVEFHRLIEQMRASERVLERKNRRLEELYQTAHRFVDNVSHEFRTPLTVIMEYASLMQDGVVGELTGEQQQMLDVISDRAGDLNNMVNDMLDISKLETSMLGMWRCVCTVDDALDRVRDSLLKKASVKQIDLRFDIPEGLPEVFCDDEKIGRVLVNLVTNAIKFCGRPGKVHVWAKSDDEQRQMIIGVTDNGMGISKENREAIFQRFKQIGDNPRGSTKGFGLGLNIAKELVQLNLGEIGLDSSNGKGSTFWFTVPYASPEEVLRRFAERVVHFYNGASVVSLIRVSMGSVIDEALQHDCHAFLNTLLRRNDLLYQTEPNRWLLAMPSEQFEVEGFCQRSESARRETNRNRPSEPLPPLEVEALGTWSVPEDCDALLETATRVTRPVAVPC